MDSVGQRAGSLLKVGLLLLVVTVVFAAVGNFEVVPVTAAAAGLTITTGLLGWVLAPGLDGPEHESAEAQRD